MNDVNWGIPTKRTTKMEKFDTPVVTMSALSKKGSGRKFSFNKAAQSLLGLIGGESHIRIGFRKENGAIYIQSLITEESIEGAFQLTNNCTFSNKRIYEYIAKTKDLDSTEENHLHLEVVPSQSYVTVSYITSDSTPQTNAPEEVKEVEVEVVEEDWN